jgi:hypothetical protein
MENKLHFKINKKSTKFLNLIILVTIINCLMIIKVNANNETQNNQLIIDYPNEIYEGNNFPISVYTLFNNTPYYQIDVLIIFNNKTYNITYNEPEINIEAPQVTKDTYFKINAIKTGYLNDENYLMILNNENKSKLIITLLDNDFIIEGNNYFSVLITDDKGIPIYNATIGIQSYISKHSLVYSDENGRARILAPNNRDEIIILAQKKGYITATEKIWINTNPNIIEKIIQNPYTIIIISIIILAVAITIVKVRKKIDQIKNKKQNYKKINNIKSKNEKTDYLIQINNKNHETKIKEAKVEEIRINRNEPAQKIVSLKKKMERNDSNFKENKKIIRNDKWFEGIDDIRYKIDKLTGDISSINENKWFEGKENIRNKIDEKLKKNRKH